MNAEFIDKRGTAAEREIVRKVYKQTCISIDALNAVISFNTIEVLDDLINTRIILEDLSEQHGICLHE